MGNDSRPYGATAGSVLIVEDGNVLLKKTPQGLSLPGGYLDWSHGYTSALKQRVLHDNEISFHVTGINVVTQNRTPNGTWITNFNARGYLENGTGKDLEWVSRSDILSENVPLRTPDTLEIVRRSYSSLQYPLDTILVNCDGEKSNLTAELSDANSIGNPYEVGVYSMVVRSGDKYLLMECAREIDLGKLSLIGGKIDYGLGLIEGTLKETGEETGKPILPFGIVGVYVNRYQGRFIPNICTFAEVPNEFTMPPNDEVADLHWLTLDEVRNTSPLKFRTLDALQSITRADYLVGTSQLLPLDFVKTISH